MNINSTSKIQFTTTFLYVVRAILNSLYDYVDMIAAKRYQIYLKEDERKRRHSELTQYFIGAIFWLIKLITNSLENVKIKKKRIIEKITVE